MRRAYALDYGSSWDDKLPYAEFSYNNSYQASLQMAPFEVLYGRKCRTPLMWDGVGDRKLFGPDLIRDSEEKVKLIRDRLKIAQSRQKSYADAKRKELKKCHAEMADIPLRDTVPLEAIQLEHDLTYEEKPIKILETAERITRTKIIKFCKGHFSLRFKKTHALTAAWTETGFGQRAPQPAQLAIWPKACARAPEASRPVDRPALALARLLSLPLPGGPRPSGRPQPPTTRGVNILAALPQPPLGSLADEAYPQLRRAPSRAYIKDMTPSSILAVPLLPTPPLPLAVAVRISPEPRHSIVHFVVCGTPSSPSFVNWITAITRICLTRFLPLGPVGVAAPSTPESPEHRAPPSSPRPVPTQPTNADTTFATPSTRRTSPSSSPTPRTAVAAAPQPPDAAPPSSARRRHRQPL
nr:nascent polypeptide-associated complex subunit alpha, muscle-specific form-like [Aegilops tauschii subsp. strangulata]